MLFAQNVPWNQLRRRDEFKRRRRGDEGGSSDVGWWCGASVEKLDVLYMMGGLSLHC